MSIILVILAVLLGLAATFSAVGKLRRMPQVVESMHHVGVSDSQIPLLAVLELLGALGLLVGIWVPVLGWLAALGLTLYFLGAVIMHVRKKDTVKEFGPALGLMVLSIVVLVLEFLR